ncbi:MAG: hypothetical protein JSR21_10230 [Proteobacteria bacterium]|nr:hypothetical protein [Pseudomonadota bacterium]
MKEIALMAATAKWQAARFLVVVALTWAGLLAFPTIVMGAVLIVCTTVALIVIPVRIVLCAMARPPLPDGRRHPYPW